MNKEEFINKLEKASPRGFTVKGKNKKDKYHIKWDIDEFVITMPDDDEAEPVYAKSTSKVVSYFKNILDLK